jgi:hypothetical protein
MCEDYATMGGMIITGLFLIWVIGYGIYRLIKWVIDYKRIKVDWKECIACVLAMTIATAIICCGLLLCYGLAWCIGYLACLIMAL